jgi:hypothetical protein
MGDLTPWWVATATGIVAALAGVVGKLWANTREEVAELRTANAQLRHELSEANNTIVKLQQDATERGDGHQREHLRDLRRFAGLSTSIDPPPQIGGWPPAIVRAPPSKHRPQPRKRPRSPPEDT